jgi:hypothetical protein
LHHDSPTLALLLELEKDLGTVVRTQLQYSERGSWRTSSNASGFKVVMEGGEGGCCGGREGSEGRKRGAGKMKWLGCVVSFE